MITTLLYEMIVYPTRYKKGFGRKIRWAVRVKNFRVALNPELLGERWETA